MNVATRPRVLTVLLASAALAATALAAAPAAEAGPPGHWTRLTTTTMLGNTAQPSLVRFGRNLEVVWSQDDTATTSSIRAKAITLAGAAQTTHTVVSGWSSVVSDPAPFIEGGQLKVAFGGIRSTSVSEKYDGPMAYATSTNGTSWTLGSEALTKTSGAYASDGMDAIDNAGSPFVALTNSPADLVTVHSGIGPGFPSTAPDRTTSATGGCCDYSATLARDTKTKHVWAAWYSNSTTKDGIWVQDMSPVKGTLIKAPGSHTSTGATPGSLPPDQDVAMVARPGGGIWVAYVLGYPSATKIRLWKVGTSTVHDFTAPGARAVALGLGLNGRIWLGWNDPGTSSIKAVRSNKTVSKFGAVRSVVAPNAKAFGSVYKVAIDGTKGPLDVVINADVPGKGYQALYHTQIYAPLLVKLSRTSVKSSTGGSITVTVTEAGSVVTGARVTFGGASTHTNSHGKATIHVAKHASKGKKTVTVSLTYYVTTKLTVRVT